MATCTANNVRHAFYIAVGITALLTTWPYAFDWIARGGNIFNPVDFFGDAIGAGGTASFLSIDMAIAWLVFMVWVVSDSKRIGAGYKWGCAFVALSYIGVSMAFPFYLVFRERYIADRTMGESVGDVRRRRRWPRVPQS
jgi:Terpene cyclase DEP1